MSLLVNGFRVARAIKNNVSLIVGWWLLVDDHWTLPPFDVLVHEGWTVEEPRWRF